MSTEAKTLHFVARPDFGFEALQADAMARFGRILPEWRGTRVFFACGDGVDALQAVLLARLADLDMGLAPARRLTSDVRDSLVSAGFRIFDMASGEMIEPAVQGTSLDVVPGRVSMLTSGTTGAPKLIEHDWGTLNTLGSERGYPRRNWFVPYQTGTYAWYQMVCLWLFQDGQGLFVPDENDLVGGFVSSLARGVDAVSATPTFMRYVLLTTEEQELRRAQMQTVTLGGEIVDQAILDRLAQLWPGCTLRHIYASTEVGAAIVVQDGREGFPAALLERGEAGILQLKDGRLLVRSKFASRSMSGSEWVETGDLVEVVGDRVLFRGRAGSAMINVGGMKAFPAEIESVLLGHPGVLWARVRARRAPLVGSLPAAQVVLTPSGAGLSDAERQLSDFLRGRVPDHAVPRFWEFLDVVPATASLKS